MSKVIDLSQARTRLRPPKAPTSQQILLFVPAGKQKSSPIPNRSFMTKDECEKMLLQLQIKMQSARRRQQAKFALVFSSLLVFITAWMGCTGFYLDRFSL